MVKRMEISQARGNLSDLTKQAAEGESIILTRYGKDVAQLGPIASFVAAATPHVQTRQQGIDALLRGAREGKPVESGKNGPKTGRNATKTAANV